MTIKPIGERVLIKVKKEEKTSGGVYIPESAQSENKEGYVVAVGTYEDGSELPVNEGDKIIYGGYQTDEIDIDGEKHIFVDLKDILAKVEE
ncbi:MULTISPECIES: co-chaperone GroES [Methanohalobium]|jgi:chaperonin GroES|uniref:Co-chaperonin GroES n=1 Tax=Methanohalobium evestigatum (strain ATCC BAA-1072 / DSM 3721 / NBRC 107634 / OCM 161 / Z-7303) TaxID=644295 RepID=D7EAL2_METEZ|nr:MULTISPECIES: co-chaperone GroES [Methanohalobium]ADI75011.1 Chaperonin Cpn10 [Methanohalobium evestigatum Z-7303]